METFVYNRDKPLTVIDEIYQKIAKVEGDRKTVEEKILQNHSKILRMFDEHCFKFENQEKHVKTMTRASEDALNEMQELKVSIIDQNKAFMENLERINKNLITDQAELRD